MEPSRVPASTAGGLAVELATGWTREARRRCPICRRSTSGWQRLARRYAIIADVRHRTGDAMPLTASTLYAALKRLLDDPWIEALILPLLSGGPGPLLTARSSYAYVSM
jgi:hypothetical protein